MTRDGGTCMLHVVDRSGDEPVVVFLHHLGGSSATWSRVAEHLSRNRCVAADLRGFGESVAEHGCGYSMAENADDVAQLIRRLDVRRYVLVGHFSPPVLEAAVVRPLARARLLVLPRVGHLAPREAPAELASAIARSVASSDESLRSATERDIAKDAKRKAK